VPPVIIVVEVAPWAAVGAARVATVVSRRFPTALMEQVVGF